MTHLHSDIESFFAWWLMIIMIRNAQLREVRRAWYMAIFCGEVCAMCAKRAHALQTVLRFAKKVILRRKSLNRGDGQG